MTLPRFIEPALPVLRPGPAIGQNWSHEVKFDGWRLQTRREGGTVALLSRRGRDLTDRFTKIARAVAQIPGGDFLLDGEVIALGPDGHPDFDALSQRDARHCICAFDVLFVGGEDVRGQSLLARRAELSQLLRGAPNAFMPSRHSPKLTNCSRRLSGLGSKESCRSGRTAPTGQERDRGGSS